jgi:ribosomal protein L16 Arg81 hydroxylase
MWSQDQEDRLTAAWLLQPHSIDEFSRTYYERAPLHVVREKNGYYADYFSLAEFERVLFGTQLVADDVMVCKDGLPARRETYQLRHGRSVKDEAAGRDVIDSDRVSALFAHGCSVVLDAVQKHSTPVGKLCRGLESFLGHRVNANVYMTPPNSQGFSAHYDTHDTVILQIEGSKRWQIYGPALDLPLREQLFDAKTLRPGPVLQQIELRAGDLLYLPRGVVHEAKASATFSLHVTLGLHPILWADVVHEALRRSSAKDVALRASASANGPARADGSELAAALQQAFSPENLADVLRGLERTFATERHNDLEGQLQQLVRLPDLSAASIVAVRHQMLYEVTEGEDEATVSFSGKTIKLPRGAASLVRILDQSSPLHVRALLEHDPNALDVVRRLIQEGFVVQLEHASAGEAEGGLIQELAS